MSSEHSIDASFINALREVIGLDPLSFPRGGGRAEEEEACADEGESWDLEGMKPDCRF